MDTKTNERLIRLSEVMSRTGRSRSSIYDDINNDRFPKPVAIGERAVAWRASEIDQWIASRETRPTTGVDAGRVVSPKKKAE